MLEGVVESVEEGWFQAEIAESAYRFERKVNEGRRVIVGVNRYTEGDDEVPHTLAIGAEVEQRQLERLAAVKQARHGDAVRSALRRLAEDAADPHCNLFPALMERPLLTSPWVRWWGC